MRRLLPLSSLVALLSSCPPAAVEVLHEERPADYTAFWPARVCNNCHERLVSEHSHSTHAAAFSDPVFQAQLYGQLLPRAAKDPSLQKEADSCLGCHSPITFLQHSGRAVPSTRVDRGLAGVTCDFCHTVRGYKGATPGNANYISVPGELKLGGMKIGGDWHHGYSKLITTSEFCAICHTTQNSHGVALRTTYDEWKESVYAKRGVQCQDCHMTERGFLVDGEPKYSSQPIAKLTGGITAPPAREHAHSHRFPGAHSQQQVTNALSLNVAPWPRPLVRGETIQIGIDVVNANVGHRIPTGSVELRAVWLEVRVATSDDDPGVVLKARSLQLAGAPLDVVGGSELERQLLREDAPAGSRVYRAVFLDEKGLPTLTNYEARKLLFDNRLGAAEVRREVYDYVVPERLEEDNDLHVTATLMYLRYPSLFAEGIDVEFAEPVQIAQGTGLIGKATERDER